MTVATDTSGASAGAPLRRNIGILAIAQALFQSIQGMAISTTPLAALSILGGGTTLIAEPQFRWLGLASDGQLATVPIFLAHLGLMTTTIPASLLMARLGRRAGVHGRRVRGHAVGRDFALWNFPAELRTHLSRIVFPGYGRRFRLVFPFRRRRCRRRQLQGEGDITGYDGRRVGRAGRAANREVECRSTRSRHLWRCLRYGDGLLRHDRDGGAGPRDPEPDCCTESARADVLCS